MAEQNLAWDIFLPIPLLPNNCWYKLTTNPLVTGHRPIKSPSARVTPNTTQITRRMEESLDQQLQQKVGRIEPTIVILTSILVGVILMAVMLPLIHIMSSIG